MRIIQLLLTAIMVLILSGCGHVHTWEDATCTEPQKCIECGATEGEALGHDWAEATCDSPKICNRCGITEGEALGHDWVDATCETPKTCSRCGITEGEALGHEWMSATTEAPKTCKVCGKTEGDPISVKIYDFSEYYKGYRRGAFNSDLGVFVRYKQEDYGQDIVEILDASDGEVVSSQIITYGEYDGRYAFWGYNFPYSYGLTACNKDPNHQNSRVILLGWDGEILIDDTVPINLYLENNKWNDVFTSDDNIISIVVGDDSKPIRYYNLQTSEILDPGEIDVELLGDVNTHRFSEKIDEPYDETVWSYCDYQPIIDGFLVKRASDEKWGYVDKDFNEIVIYDDATAFCELGYALVSEDRNHYYLIDSDFNKICDLEGDYKSAGMCGGNLFSVCKPDDSYIEVVLK